VTVGFSRTLFHELCFLNLTGKKTAIPGAFSNTRKEIAMERECVEEWGPVYCEKH
jgi:hypothetical protein